MSATDMKVGELARWTGLTVRTLHHYEAIGLLPPTQRTESGHRLYGPTDVEQLQKIASLRQLGFSLAEIRSIVDGSNGSLLAVIELQIERIRQQIALQRQLTDQLELIAGRLRHGDDASVDDLLKTMELMKMIDEYYTADQLEWLRQRREQVGEARIREVEAEWPRLMAEVRAEMEAGTDPADPNVQALMARWRGLVAEFTGGNSGIERSLNSFYENEDTMPTGEAIDRKLFAYVGQAMAAGNP